MADDTKKDAPCTDHLVAGPELEGGVRPFIRHTADHEIHVGTMRLVKEGAPMMPGEGAFALRDRGEGHFDVTPLVEPQPKAEGGHKGPARVNTRAYQEGWDALFGKRPAAQA